jgi:hypothetical protein
MPTAPRKGKSKRMSVQQHSEALLQDLLGTEEYTRLMQRGYLEVRSRNHPERAYHIPRGMGLVTVYEQEEPVELLCIGPAEPLPPADVLVAHKLLIETNEDVYLRTANHLSLRSGDWRIVGGRVRLALTPWLEW